MKDVKNKSMIVITGIGIVSSIGFDKETVLNAIKAGKSGEREVDEFDVENLGSKKTYAIRDFNLQDVFAIDTRKIGRGCEYCLTAVQSALLDAKFEEEYLATSKVGTVIGSTYGSINKAAAFIERIDKRGPKFANPLLVADSMPNAIASHISINWKFTGPSITEISGMLSGIKAICLGRELLLSKKADIIIAGGASECGEARYKLYEKTGLLSSGENEACRPFDVNRNGMILGDGSAVVVMERLSDAVNRGSDIYAVFHSYGDVSDICGGFTVDKEGTGLALSMEQAIAEAGIQSTDIDFICANANSTVSMDLAEARAIRHVFGDSRSNPRVSALKSLIGETIGASGAMGIAVTALLFREGYLFPTLNTLTPLPELNGRLVSEGKHNMLLNHALVNAMDFGGGNVSVLLSRYEEG